MGRRLQDALGWTIQYTIDTNRSKVREGSWTRMALCDSLRSCVTQPDIMSCDDAILADLGMQLSDSTATTGDQGGAGDAAMCTRLRKPGNPEAAPSLAYRCDLCEAQGCNDAWKRMHIDYVHGGLQRYRNAVSVMRSYSGPYVPDATDKRATIQAARQCQEFATTMPETLITDNGAKWWEQLQTNVYAGAQELWQCVMRMLQTSKYASIHPQELKPKVEYSKYAHPTAQKRRQFEA